MNTHVEIEYNSLYGFASRNDILSLTCDDEQTFVNLDDVIWENVYSPYATYEPDFWLLDGSYHFKPSTNEHTGLISLNQTNGSGVGSPVTITITFNVDHHTSGLNFKFGDVSGDWPLNLVVTFYNSSNAIIQNNTYHPSSATFSTSQAVVFFRKIIIQLDDTNKAYRYQRLRLLELDTITKFGASGQDPIKSCSVVEECHPLSLELPIDTATFTVMPLNPAVFNIISPSGLYADLKSKMPMYIREYLGNDSIFMGAYYLQDYKNGSNTEIDFTTTDSLGILDGLQYHGWLKTTVGGGVSTVEDLLDDILGDTGIPYEADSSIVAYYMTGYIPVCTKREALQRLAFAAKCYVTSSRHGNIQIIPYMLPGDTATIDYDITNDNESITSLELRPEITAVDFVFEEYKQSGLADSTVYETDLDAGSYTVYFNEPIYNIGISGATLTYPSSPTAEGYFMVSFTVAIAGIVSITAKSLYIVKYPYSVANGSLPTDAKENRLTVTSTVARRDGLGAFVDFTSYAQRVYDYFQERYLHKAKLFRSPAEVGKLTTIDTLHTHRIDGTIEKMSINLTGGFVADTEIIGNIV